MQFSKDVAGHTDEQPSASSRPAHCKARPMQGSMQLQSPSMPATSPSCQSGNMMSKSQQCYCAMQRRDRHLLYACFIMESVALMDALHCAHQPLAR